MDEVIYLNHASTAPTDPVVEAMLPWCTQQFGHPQCGDMMRTTIKVKDDLVEESLEITTRPWPRPRADFPRLRCIVPTSWLMASRLPFDDHRERHPAAIG